jgi:hypothetical protein
MGRYRMTEPRCVPQLATCQNTLGGDNQAIGNPETQRAFEDSANVWIGFAEAHWRSTRECAGNAATGPLTLPNPSVKEVIYHKDVALTCPGEVFYAGGVIGFGVNNTNQGDAEKAAKTKVINKANASLAHYRGQKCPGKCERSGSGRYPLTIDNATLAGDTRQIEQATNDPFVSYAFVTWATRMKCEQ